MTLPTDVFLEPRPQSCQGPHAQETGDAGLSSKMEHKVLDNYDSALSVAEEGSFVKPIPKEESHSLSSLATAKIWSYPSGSAAPKTHSVSAEEAVIKWPTQKHNFLPQNTTFSRNNPEEETVMDLPRTTAIKEEQQDVEGEGEESCTKMENEENPEKPKGPPLVVGVKRYDLMRAAGKYEKLYLLCLIAFVPVAGSLSLPLSELSPVRCFICVDKDRCQTLRTIVGTDDDTILYHRDLNETFPDCSEIPPPGPNKCTVCRNQVNITIYCSEDTPRKIDVEDSHGNQIVNISSGCAPQPTTRPGLVTNTSTEGAPQPTPGHRYLGLIGVPILLIIVVVVVVVVALIHNCCKKRELNAVNGQEPRRRLQCCGGHCLPETII